jgi:heme exporter protein C
VGTPTKTQASALELETALLGPGSVARPSTRRRVLGWATVAAFAILAWAAFGLAPEDDVQGAPQRIFYIHVPSAWIGFLAFFVVFIASLRFLAKRDLRYDAIAVASAEIGLLFTTGVLITGPLWARPIWGVFWSWDPRLTSFLVLWLIYLSYLAMRQYVPDPMRRARFSAVLGIVGFADVPVVYLSVRWWRALHPDQVVFVNGGPRMPGEMVIALLIGIGAFTLFYLYLLTVRLRVQRLRDASEEDA